MKQLNKITIETLKELSDNDKVSRDAAFKLFGHDKFYNTYNYAEVKPEVVQFFFPTVNTEYGLVSLHLGGDVRGNYSDYYVLDYDDALDVISDKIDLELETQEDIDHLTKWLENNHPEVFEDYKVEIGNTIHIDSGNCLELMLTPINDEVDNYLDLGCDTKQQFDLLSCIYY